MRPPYQPPILTPAQEFVRHALEIGALKLYPEGRKLKSGRISPYFFDSAQFTTNKKLAGLGNAYAEVIAAHHAELAPDVLFGPAYKGISIAVAAALSLSAADGIELGWAHDRKEEKDHAEGGSLVGASVDGKRVIIIDDVVTDGATKVESFELITRHGGTVVGFAIAFDRQEMGVGTERSAAGLLTDRYGIPVYAAATLDDLMSLLRVDTDFPNNPPDMLQKIEVYHAQYGVTY